MKELKDLTIGDRLWYVPSNSKHSSSTGRYLIVEKVGRKYVHAGGMKVEPWNNCGYSVGKTVEWPHGIFYLTQEDYLKHVKWVNIECNFDRLKLTLGQKENIIAILEKG